MKIAVGYVRCSTDMQEDSIEQQRKAIELWAQKNAFKIIEWFEDEGKSGTTFEKRPGFRKLQSRVENSPNFEYVLVYDESRWGRTGDPRESNYWKVHFQKRGVSVRIINSQSKQENDIGSYVVEVVESAEASEYSKKLSRSTLRGCNDNALRGFSNGGTAPYGYRRTAIHKDTGEIVRELRPGDRCREREEKVRFDLGDESEFSTVKRIFNLKIQGYGYRAIADSLNKERIPCPKRGRWRNKNQMWSAGTIQSIITNPTYCGDRIYNRHPLSKKRVKEANVLGVTKDRWISDETDWIIQRDAHRAIITRELFDRANGTRRQAGRFNQHHYQSPYLLTGLVKCEKCGFNYQGQSYRSENIFYYVDGGNMNKGKSVCDRLAIRKEKLEGFVLDMIRDLPHSKVASRFEDLIAEYLSRRGSSNTALEDIVRKLKEADIKMQNLLDLAERGIDQETILPCMKALEETKRKLESERLVIERISGKAINVKDASQRAAEFFLKFHAHFDKAPVQERKELIRQVVLGIQINPIDRIATCAITKIPMATPALTALINPSEFFKIKHPVGAHCSGGRT